MHFYVEVLREIRQAAAKKCINLTARTLHIHLAKQGCEMWTKKFTALVKKIDEEGLVDSSRRSKRARRFQ